MDALVAQRHNVVMRVLEKHFSVKFPWSLIYSSGQKGDVTTVVYRLKEGHKEMGQLTVKYYIEDGDDGELVGEVTSSGKMMEQSNLISLPLQLRFPLITESNKNP